MDVGDPVLLRSSYRGNVRWCWPHRYVGEWDGRLGIYCAPGSQGKLIKHVVGDSYLDYWIGDGPAFDASWDRTNVLRFEREGCRHTVEIFWDLDWNHLGWYVNLQAPLRVRGDRLDTTDHALDVWVEPDGAWRWKDETHLSQAVALGVLDEAEAALVRVEGKRVVEAAPWPTGWEDWRPPSDWGPLPLPEEWHVVG